MNVKQIIVALFLVIGVGVAVYMWSGMGAEVDEAVMSRSQNFKCAQCGHEFSLTVGEERAMRAAKGTVVCPACNADATVKKDVMVNMGAPSLGTEEDDSEPEEVPEGAPPRRGGGQMSKVNQ